MEKDMENSCWKIIITIYQAPIMCQTTAKVQLWSDISSSQYPRRRQWQPAPVLLPGKSHGWRNLVGCSPSGHYESDTTEWLHFHSSLSCIGEGNGNPLQCSCLENPRDGGVWWAAFYGVAQSWTWLKWLSSSTVSRWDICCHLHFIDEENKAHRGLVTYPWSAAKKL